MTSTLPAPAVEVERIPLREAMARILAATDLPDIMGVHQNGQQSDLLGVTCASIADVAAWMPFFGAVGGPKPVTMENGDLFAVQSAHGWYGWYVQISGRDPKPEFDGPDCAVCGQPVRPGQEIVAGHKPMTVVHAACDDPTCRSCGGEMTHRAGCPSDHADDWHAPCMVAPSCLRPQIENARRGGCAEHDVDIDHEAATARAESLATAPECVDCTVPGGSHQESCAFASRVDVEAAADIPVVIYDPTAPDSPLRALDGMGHWTTPFESAPNPAPARDFDDEIAAVIADPRETIPYTTINPDDSCGYLPGLPPQRLFAEAVDRLADGMLGESAGFDEPTQQLPCASVPKGVQLIHLAEHPVGAPEEAFHADRYDAGSTS